MIYPLEVQREHTCTVNLGLSHSFLYSIHFPLGIMCYDLTILTDFGIAKSKLIDYMNLQGDILILPVQRVLKLIYSFFSFC